jgi:hypothetical protein
MKTKLNLLFAGLFLAATSSALATVRYVNVNNANPTPPYTNWVTAATNIQDAVDAAGAGDEIVVTNGTYAPVTVNKPLTLQSVNGPDVTVIDGGGVAQCAYLTNNAVIMGFSLTNGWSGYGGGVYCESSSAVVTNCVLTGNSAGGRGGGAYGGTLNNCTLTGNSAFYRGWDCPLICFAYGGGASSCTLNNCTLSGNSASGGGGAIGCTLNNCTLIGNSGWEGGGAENCTLNNCALSGNSASGLFGSGKSGNGGGANGCSLNNCTLTGNSATGLSSGGGGAYACTLNNCIVYYNSDSSPFRDNNYDPSSTLNYCCTTPMPTSGGGNISADPQLASAWYLSAQSPCIGAGSAKYASGTDIDGEAWANPPSIGCDEYHAGAVTGPLTVSLTATYTNVATGFPVGLTGLIAGRTDLSVWDFGDGYVQVNEPYTSHTWTAPGDYLVALWAFNDSYPGGVSATVTVHVEAEVLHYVAATSGNPVAPYTSWATAATNIQDAVDVAGAGDKIVVTNGFYAPVTVNTPLTLQSVNGPTVTVINGLGATQCVYLANDAVLMGFTLTNGWSDGYGGGVYCESSAVLTNCVMTGNLAWSGDGGGAYGGTLNNCTLTGNSASWYGGGAIESRLNNCTLTGNSALEGGGAYGCLLNNCIVYFNSDPNDGGNYDPSSTLNYCCTTPMPTNGVGNITNDPLFVNYAGGNLRLQSNSPCINSGNNAYVVGSTDLDGRPRIVGGTVDMGAYEFQAPGMGEFIGWLQQYGLPTDGSADYADMDGNGMNNWQKWIAALNPTDAASVLKMTSATPTNNPAGLVVTWESVNTRTYYLQRSTNLVAQPAFSTIQSNIVGQAGTMSYTDTTATNAGPYFYRVGVGN